MNESDCRPQPPQRSPQGEKRRGPSRAQGARNFLRVFDTLLKTVQLDYVDCARYETSGYAEFIGKLYTLNSGMFQSAVFCDRTLTQMMLHYLAWFQDPGVRVEVGPGAAWRMVERIRAQRFGDALYVTWAAADAGVRVGERIVKINKMTLDEIRPEVERTLRTTVEPADPEREDWTLVLAFAKFLTVEGADGSQRTVEVVPGESAVADRLRAAIAERAAARAEPGGEGVSGPARTAADGVPEGPGTPGAGAEAALPAVELHEEGGVAVLTVRDLAAPHLDSYVERLEDATDEGRTAVVEPQLDVGAERLVIDVRGARGGTQDHAYALVPLVMAPGTRATPAELFGAPGVLMNYSRRNVDAELADLEERRRAIRAAGGRGAGCADGGAEASEGAGPSDLSDVGASIHLAALDELSAELEARRGSGLALDANDYYLDAEFAAPASGPRKVVVLADRYTSDAAEWLVRAARSAGFATVAGRATAGSIDNTCPRAVRLDEDFTLVFPAAKYRAATEGAATLGRGIVPDVHIPWTPGQLERDVDLERACELARG